MRISDIARVAHEVNLAYCRSIGDDSQKAWDKLSESIQNSAIDGVEFHISHPSVPPSASHDNWLAFKAADGWVYGEEKCEDAKTHPCMVPFDELPIEQKVKDYLFSQVVASLKPFLTTY